MTEIRHRRALEGIAFYDRAEEREAAGAWSETDDGEWVRADGRGHVWYDAGAVAYRWATGEGDSARTDTEESVWAAIDAADDAIDIPERLAEPRVAVDLRTARDLGLPVAPPVLVLHIDAPSLQAAICTLEDARHHDPALLSALGRLVNALEAGRGAVVEP